MGMLCGLHHYNHANVFDAEGILTVGTIPGAAGYFDFLISYGSLSGDLMPIPGPGVHLCKGIFSSTFADFNVFYSSLPGELDQDAFTTFIVYDGTGTKREYHTADAYLFTWATGLNRWAWGNGGGDRVYEEVDDGEQHDVAVIF